MVTLVRCIKRLIEVGDYIIAMLNAHTQPDHFRFHAGLTLLIDSHLSMSCRGGVAGQRLRVTNINQPLEQLERVVELLARLEAADGAKHQQ